MIRFFLIFGLCFITTSEVFSAQYPLPFGVVTSSVGWRKDPFGSGKSKYHRGVDISAPTGTPVFSTAPGVVSYAKWNNGGYGWLVVVDHQNGFFSMYGHNSKLRVSVGQHVDLRTVLAEVGSTGRSTGPHLHYEVRYWPYSSRMAYAHY